MILKLKPIFFEKVWGGSGLRDIFGYDTSNNTGECWGISAHHNGSSIVDNGIYKGRSLKYLFDNHRNLFGDYEGSQFPILVKLIDAKEDLSIQVHPSDSYALKNENSLGKTECWYILHVEKDTKITIGHSANSKEELIEYMQNNEYKKFLNNYDLNKGDFFYLNPGTIHAICAGTLLLEVQQSSDITYRLYDYDRLYNGSKRELHTKKALDVITIPDNVLDIKKHNTYFSFELLSNDSETSYISHCHGDYIVILEGKGFFNDVKVSKGDFLMISSAFNYSVTGTIKYQRTFF